MSFVIAVSATTFLKRILKVKFLTVVLTVTLMGCEATSPKPGTTQSQTAVTGAAAGDATHNASSVLEKCASPLGTVALVEETLSDWYRAFVAQ